MRAVRVRNVVPLVAAMSLLAFACASPPEAEKKAADAAVSAAQSAGAEKYAPSEFSAMTAAVKKAESEMSNKAYKEAKASYESAKDLADRAAKAAESGKAAAKTEAEKQLADLESRWKELQGQAEAAGKKLNFMGNDLAQPEEWRARSQIASATKLKADQKATWEADAKSVSDAFDAAKAALATNARAVKDKLAAIPAVLDKWEADLTALATPKKDEKKPAVKK